MDKTDSPRIPCIIRDDLIERIDAHLTAQVDKMPQYRGIHINPDPAAWANETLEDALAQAKDSETPGPEPEAEDPETHGPAPEPADPVATSVLASLRVLWEDGPALGRWSTVERWAEAFAEVAAAKRDGETHVEVGGKMIPVGVRLDKVIAQIPTPTNAALRRADSARHLETRRADKAEAVAKRAAEAEEEAAAAVAGKSKSAKPAGKPRTLRV